MSKNTLHRRPQVLCQHIKARIAILLYKRCGILHEGCTFSPGLENKKFAFPLVEAGSRFWSSTVVSFTLLFLLSGSRCRDPAIQNRRRWITWVGIWSDPCHPRLISFSHRFCFSQSCTWKDQPQWRVRMVVTSIIGPKANHYTPCRISCKPHY